MSGQAGIALLLCSCLGVALAACQSTQDTSAMKARHAKKLVAEHGLSVTRENPAVKVVATAVLHDANGTAAAVELRNTGSTGEIALPVAVAVDDAQGHSLYRNNTAGLEASLVQMPLLRKGEAAWWVDDQVTAAGVPAKVRARIGDARPAPAAVPDLRISQVRLANDIDGIYAGGVIENRSKVAQRRLTIFCVARRGGRIVAAGRAILDSVPPAPTRKPIRFKVFFIGNPKGARLELSAPPTVLK